MIEKFKESLRQAGVKFKWLGAESEGELPETPSQLPPEIVKSMNQAIAALPNHHTWLETVESALAQAVKNWRENRDNENIEGINSLVVLTSPVESLSDLLKSAVSQWEQETSSEKEASKEGEEQQASTETEKQREKPLQVRSLKWPYRPHDYAHISNQLQALFNEKAPEKSGQLPASEELIAIPRLESCFLRCIGGLEGIEYLRDTIFKDRSRFFAIGCNQWTWKYLDRLYKVSAYFEHTISLPALTGEQLLEWFAPVLSAINLGVDDESEKLAKSESEYFENLAAISQGIPSVAASLWLRSLWYEPSTDGNSPAQLKQKKAKLPDLPNLLPEDRYILYSLLLHGYLSLSHLAVSLGESEATVQARVQFLLQNDVMQRRHHLLFVSPAHYPKLQATLENNNFLVGD